MVAPSGLIYLRESEGRPLYLVSVRASGAEQVGRLTIGAVVKTNVPPFSSVEVGAVESALGLPDDDPAPLGDAEVSPIEDDVGSDEDADVESAEDDDDGGGVDEFSGVEEVREKARVSSAALAPRLTRGRARSKSNAQLVGELEELSDVGVDDELGGGVVEDEVGLGVEEEEEKNVELDWVELETELLVGGTLLDELVGGFDDDGVVLWEVDVVGVYECTDWLVTTTADPLMTCV